MILEDIEIRNNKRKKVTRICDDCGKKETARMDHVWVGRNKRGKIDLCSKCANSSRHRKNSSWDKGEKSPSWRGGVIKTPEGLTKIYISPGKYEYEHRIIVSERIGRPLRKGEMVHHINSNRTDNREDNLLLLNNEQEHRNLHALIEKYSFSLFQKEIWFNSKKICYTLEKTTIEKIPYEDKDGLYGLKRWIWGNKYKNGTVRKYDMCYIKEPKYGRRQKQLFHIAVMEQKIGRQVYKNEVIHHIDNNSLNNSPDNLLLMTYSSHKKIHWSIQKCFGKLIDRGEIDGKVFSNIGIA